MISIAVRTALPGKNSNGLDLLPSWRRIMRYPWKVAFSITLMCCLVAAGKDKKKIILPTDVLEARTVLVVIDPEAGIAVDAPNANRTAQGDVEKALMNWGRFTLAPDVSTADLVISVRKGNGKVVQPTIGGVPTNNRAGYLRTYRFGRRDGRTSWNAIASWGSHECPTSRSPSPDRGGAGTGYVCRVSRQARQRTRRSARLALQHPRRTVFAKCPCCRRIQKADCRG